MKKTLLLILACCLVFDISAQETIPVNGVHNKTPEVYAFTNCVIYLDYRTSITNATLVIRKGVIEAVGREINIPKEAVIYDLGGKFIYPSFIDIYTDYGIKKEEKEKKERRRTPQMLSNKKGAYYWNQAIIPEYDAYLSHNINAKAAREFRALGFGCVVSHRNDGIARGSGVLTTLADEKEHKTIIKDKAAAFYSFSKGSSTQNYPNSLMGSIALLRQTYLDGQWYKRAKGSQTYNISLEAWNQLLDIPQIFEVRDKLSIMRADKLGDEFNVQYIFKGNGHEYMRIQEIKATEGSLIIPLNFPLPYDVTDPYDAMQVSLSEMKHWEMAPANAAMLEKEEITFALTMAGLKNKKEFWENLRKAIAHGLSEEMALKALTHNPAIMLGVQNKVGSIAKGKIANFLITSGNIFKEGNVIYQNWVNGHHYQIREPGIASLNGKYNLVIEKIRGYQLYVGSALLKPSVHVQLKDSAKIKVSAKLLNDLITLVFPLKKDPKAGKVRLSGTIKGKKWEGKGQLSDGTWVKWSATYVGPYKEKKKEKKEEKRSQIGKVIYPFIAYGWVDPPKQETVIFKNVTVWTNEEEGILTTTDVLIENGKISKIGKNISHADARVIDGTGKHLTSGIIDEHTHIAISRGVNEGTQASSAEVRIGDVVNSEDINIYRALSGGVTASQLLHGSANPIGGQSAIIKLRWGYQPEDMKIEWADGFIKFALGENVKQSNWGDHNTIRFPQTRMGVEQVFYSHFIRTIEYEKAWIKYGKLSKKEKQKATPPRKDLEMEALLEILRHERFITCHSYVQSEVNMLIHVADSIGFKVNTFTHILEGYKVADKIKAHGAGASTFSDWWAYKYEVIDAIPYNTALLNEVGIVTAINSDDAEMGRRLNQEAAKAIKYGGLTPEEAWKLVTLNPAILLHLDHRMGSIKVGKDADLVLWSGDPLSVYSKVEKTYIDGQCFFDSEKDMQMRIAIQQERQRLIQLMLAAKKKGEKTQKAKLKNPKTYSCKDIDHL